MTPRRATFFLLVAALLTACTPAGAQQRKLVITENRTFRANLNAEFRDSTQSPLTPADRASFKKLKFFPIRPQFRVVATLYLTPEEKPFEMQRSKGNTSTYRKYANATFTLRGRTHMLAVYQYLKLLQDPRYANDLFLPFADQSNGSSTYHGGRFLDLSIPAADTLVIDFNKAYNPLCNYNPEKYSCPIPPSENFITQKIRAGVKSYRKHQTKD